MLPDVRSTRRKPIRQGFRKKYFSMEICLKTEYQKQSPGVVLYKEVHKNFRNELYLSLCLNLVADWRYFPVNFPKFLRTHNLCETCTEAQKGDLFDL